MKTQDLKQYVTRDPFRPFSVTLNSGDTFEFLEPRDMGAPKSGESFTLIHFGKDDWTLIDTDSIASVASL